MEAILAAAVRAAVAAVTTTAWLALALPHVTAFVIAVVATWTLTDTITMLGLVIAVAVTVLAWAILHRPSLRLVLRCLGCWRAAVWGRRTWHRTVKGLQLDAQDGQRLRAPRVRKVRAS